MRVVVQLLAVLLALALTALGALVVVEAVWALHASTPLVLPYTSLAAHMRASHWDDASVEAILGAIVVAGLVVFVVALVPPRRRRLALRPLAGDPGNLDSAITRGGLQRLLRAAATSVDGIGQAKVTAGRGRVRVTARSRLRDTRGQAAQVSAAVSDAVEHLSLTRRRPVRVVLHKARSA